MKKQIILVDSNAYFRLYLHLLPFLGKPIGEYVFYILPELENEYKKSNRLKEKFDHFFSKEYVEDRKNTLKTSPNNLKKVMGYKEFIKRIARSSGFTVSPVDIAYLAYCYHLNCPVVTDDKEMRELAKELDIKTFSLLEVLKLLYDNNLLIIETIRKIVGHMNWSKDNSEPNLISKYEKMFKEKFPDYP